MKGFLLGGAVVFWELYAGQALAEEPQQLTSSGSSAAMEAELQKQVGESRGTLGEMGEKATETAREQYQSAKEAEFWLTGSYSPWYASWEQESTAASRFGDDALTVDYSIDPTLAHSGRVEAGYWHLSGHLEHIEQAASASSGATKGVQYLSGGLNYTDLVGETSLKYRYLKGEFQGFISGAANDGRTGAGTFETDVVLQDLTLQFGNGLGLGYRHVDYTFPQDVYLVATDTPNDPIQSGFGDMRHTGHFGQITYVNRRIALQEGSGGIGVGIGSRFGYGYLEPGGDFLDRTESQFRANDLIGESEYLMGKGESWFYEVDANIQYQWALSASSILRLAGGYRTTFWSAEFKDDGADYALVADFESTFRGPYLRLSVRYN